MRHYLQYHNVAKLGWVPLDERPFLQTHLSIATRKTTARDAVGATVFVIASLRKSRRRRFYLWEHFIVEGVTEEDDNLCVWGTGRQLTPPALLEGDDFKAFMSACANFVGFRNIDKLPYTQTLARLCERPTCVNEECEQFCTQLIEVLPKSVDVHYYRGWVRQRLGRTDEAIADLQKAIRRQTEFLDAATACLHLAEGQR